MGCRAWGPPDVLREEEVAEPVPGPGQVVVEVEAAGVTWVETQVRAGRPPHPAMAPALPAVLGNGEVGRAAFERLRPGGRFVAYGMASGRWAGVSEADAARRGVVLAAGGRPDPAEAAERSGAALAEAAAGRLRAVVGQTFPLGGAAEAHAAMEARRTVGKTLLLPAAA
jgi:NADPH:quinone reductase-like Zn-dependent oxidoreductase